MQRMGLTAAQLQAYHRALRDSHTITIQVSVMNLAGQVLQSITPVVLSGQVVVDLDAEVTRSLNLELWDPHHALHFDSDDPTDGALFSDRMVRVYYKVKVAELGRHVTAVPFTGPVTRFERHGDTVSIEAQGKEALGLRPGWVPLTIKKATEKVDAIRTILANRSGETRFSLPEHTKRIPKPLTLARLGQPWKQARTIANSMDRQLFYPGTGVCTMRSWPAKPVYTFSTGDAAAKDPDMLTDLAVTYTMRSDFANVIEVIGGKPKGAKHRVRYTAEAPASHPLSPTRLGRNGVKGYVVARIENDKFRSRAECRRHAETVLAARLRETVEVACDVLPMPHLDEGDMVAFATSDGTIPARLRRFVLPLHTEGNPPMSVGYLRNTIIRKKEIRRP